jgi:hypothetical protein
MRGAVVALVLGMLLGMGCDDTIDAGDAEDTIKRDLEQRYPAATITDLDCPDEPDEDDVLTCDTTIEGTPVQVSVVLDEDLDYDQMILDKAVIARDAAQETIPGQILEQTGGRRVDLDCGPDPYLIGVPGDTFDCTVTGARTATHLVITIVNVDGELTAQLM